MLWERRGIDPLTSVLIVHILQRMGGAMSTSINPQDVMDVWIVDADSMSSEWLLEAICTA